MINLIIMINDIDRQLSPAGRPVHVWFPANRGQKRNLRVWLMIDKTEEQKHKILLKSSKWPITDLIKSSSQWE